jgi:hypothetical protein
VYSVIRFYNVADRSAVDALGQQLQDLLGEKFNGPSRSNPNCVTFSIAKDKDWFEQKEIIASTIHRIGSLIHTRKSLGEGVIVDVLVKRRDFQNRWRTSFPCELSFLKLLCSYQVELALTVHGAGPDIENRPIAAQEGAG